MNARDRQERQFDHAAQQAQIEGTSSFGRMSGSGWTISLVSKYRAAAQKRDVEFAIDDDGVGYFTADC